MRARVQYRLWSRVLGETKLLSSTSAKFYDCSSVGLLYLWSADSIRKGTANGLEGALGESGFTLLLL